MLVPKRIILAATNTFFQLAAPTTGNHNNLLTQGTYLGSIQNSVLMAAPSFLLQMQYGEELKVAVDLAMEGAFAI
jgi:hypothetical protein